MKKLAILVFVAILAVSFSSCQKEDLNNINNSNNELLKKEFVFEPSFLVNENNYYDEFGLKMINFYCDLISIFSDSLYNNYDLFEKKLNDIIKHHENEMYPKFDTINYSEYESSIINQFLNDISLESLKETSLHYENIVISDISLSINQKNRLLEFISLFKFVSYYQNEIIIICEPNWEDRYDDCMRRRLAEIFNNDGNPLPEIIFLADAPLNTARLAAICAWEATLGRGNDK